MYVRVTILLTMMLLYFYKSFILIIFNCVHEIIFFINYLLLVYKTSPNST